MGKKVDVDQLVGAAEIAELVGSSPNIVHIWRRRYADFPKPVLKLRQGRLWYLPELQQWLRATEAERKKYTTGRSR